LATRDPRSGELLAVATVRKPHGVRGELQLALDTDRPGAVFRKGRVLQLGDAAGRSLNRALTVELARPFKDGLLVRLAEVADRDAAELLRGRTLLIPAEEAAPASGDEVPYHLLVGSDVLVGGERIGTVRGVLEAGGGELLAVRRPNKPEVLVPWVREMVRRVDLERREVEIDPPEGLLEL
jgi:16S rRNA processing protein RimM